MPRTAVQVEQLKDERRKAILRAARVAFARKGFATKMGEIAALAGVSHGLVYHYFPEKDSLLAAVLEEEAQAGEELMDAVLAQPGTPWSRLVFLCTQMSEGLRHEPEYLLVIVHAFTQDAAPASVRQVLDRYKDRFYGQLMGLIEQGQRAGEIAPGPPGQLTRTLMALLYGLAISRMLDPDSEPPPLELVLRVLKA